MFCTGIENSAPTLDDGRTRNDENPAALKAHAGPSGHRPVHGRKQLTVCIPMDRFTPGACEAPDTERLMTP